MAEQRKVKAWITRNGKHIPIYEDSIESGKTYQPVTKEYQNKKKAEAEHNKQRWEKAPWRDDLLDKKYNSEQKVQDIKDRGTIEKTTITKKKSVAEQNEDIKQKQIAEAQEQRAKMNGRQTLQEQVANDRDMGAIIDYFSKRALSFEKEDEAGKSRFLNNLHRYSDKYASMHGLDKMQVRRAVYDSMMDAANKRKKK